VQEGLAGALNANTARQRRRRKQQEAELHRTDADAQHRPSTHSRIIDEATGSSTSSSPSVFAPEGPRPIDHLMAGDFAVTPRRASKSREQVRSPIPGQGGQSYSMASNITTSPDEQKLKGSAAVLHRFR